MTLRFKQGVLLTIFCFYFSHVKAQETTILTLDDFFAQILVHHPVARQAELLTQAAKQEIRLARGYFDPAISTKYYSKSFKGNNYFDLWDNALKIPIWFGTDLQVGFERNSGKNINPEDYTPNEGLTSLGISIPIGQGLIIDERRATLRQAQLFSALAEAEKIKVINKLLLQAAKDYWNWALAFEKVKLNKESYDLSNERLTAVKERILQGDLAAIDSVESLIQVQNLHVSLEQSRVELQNASLLVSNYLWKDKYLPVEMGENIVPSSKGSEVESLTKESLEQLHSSAAANHPDLQKINVKIEQLDVAKRFYRDQLKPKLNLDYSLLGTGFQFNENMFGADYLADNYKVGISFYQPLFLRKERAKIQLNKIKTQETTFSFQQTNREIVNNINSAYNDWLALEHQINVQEKLITNYELLRNGELDRFKNGESSLFLINQREATLINSKIKLLELKTKYAQNKVYLYWASGNTAPGGL